MGDAAPVVELLKTDDRVVAGKIIGELIERNAERRAEQDESFKACVNIIEENYADENLLLVKPPRVHEGVAGIVAGKIKEAYGRPAAVLSESEEDGERVLKGSARSVAGVDVTALLRSHADLFVRYGGHAMAAGFTMRPENEDALRGFLRADTEALLARDPGLFSRSPEADADILPGEASLELARLLEKFEPTGEGNPKPVLRLAAQTPEGVRRMGADGRHLKFFAGGLECVLFARGDEPADLPPGDGPLDLYGSLGVNGWNGRESVQFMIRQAVCSKSQTQR
jgi:single-stranded-DNA-specific exonuclease